MIKHHLYVLAVPDLERSAAFYRDVLGFSIHDMGDPGWRMYVRDGCRIMADAWHARALAAGAVLVKQLADEPWGMREFGVRTVDGHRIMIGHQLPAA
ncbi:VOC family protein [Massilia yuzhufengensis]|uniref:Glyoxalase/Bleomycin resistance protein/Dioxygenase superfamily protein n=1 Tax=Massilia yuzhufengensis TaxID=1164594 RepID=A0A1I1KUM2_9BURK|nr:VOC family protein [Massilia yuzhufengensis]SFC64441.1 Glyoxalase/Bleomycin resistance protein/Dioxygenase superfamily protein [Massilia yuzhufengensis]